MWLRALVTGGFLAVLLSACAIVDPVDSRYDTVGRSLAKGRDESIFLNLVRASHDYPLAFTAISNVTPTMTNTSSFALPTFSFGPPNCLLSQTFSAAGASMGHSTACSFATGVPGAGTLLSNNTASNSTAVSTNFSVSTQETGGFYDGFLKPIDLVTLDYFIRQEYPRELLFWLFADSFEVGPPGPQAVGFSYNPPLSYGCPKTPLTSGHLCFKEWVLMAVLSGLTVEEVTIQKPSGGASGGPSDTGRSGSAGTKRGPETIVIPRFCFSPLLAHKAELELGEDAVKDIRRYMTFSNPQPVCGTPWPAEAQSKQPQPDTFILKPAPGLQFRIVPRSAYGVFEFLGNVMKVDMENLPPDPKAFVPRPDEALPPTLVTQNGERLVTVVHDTSERCFSHTWFYDGEYCVPESATNTKRIFSLLSQLIAIQTTATDLSITPSVRIIQ
jgi:hypothetical protein